MADAPWRLFWPTATLLALFLILNVQQYVSGIGKGKSLAFGPKFRAKRDMVYY
jgi:hypothetical protein